MREELITPCGMNCGICSSYLAFKYDIKSNGIGMPYCIGCRPRDKKCAFLKKKCDLLLQGKVQYCYQCDNFPCLSLQRIDKKYGSSFRMSMIANLEFIKEKGIMYFLEQEADKWKCPNCGAEICCHNGICFNCGLNKLTNKKKKYKWGDE
ncbi:MAG: DUF3795 domain-containing protein [Dehalococcoidales bacterium]|nr:DUF3795 domain-containing protein [Dehalococcoidales bacterium]